MLYPRENAGVSQAKPLTQRAILFAGEARSQTDDLTRRKQWIVKSPHPKNKPGEIALARQGIYFSLAPFAR